MLGRPAPLAAVQRGKICRIQQERLGRFGIFEPHAGAEPVAPLGQLDQRRPIGVGVVNFQCQVRNRAERLRHRHAGLDAARDASAEQATTHCPRREGPWSTTARPASSGRLRTSRCTAQLGSQMASTRFMDLSAYGVNFDDDFGAPRGRVSAHQVGAADAHQSQGQAPPLVGGAGAQRRPRRDRPPHVGPRGLAPRRHWPDQQPDGAAGLGRQLQAAKGASIEPPRPCHDRRRVRAPQGLVQGPPLVDFVCRMDDDRARQVEPPGGGCRGVKPVFPIDHHDRSAIALGLAGRGEGKQPGPGAIAGGQPFHERPPGQPAPEQGVQPRAPAGKPLRASRAGLQSGLLNQLTEPRRVAKLERPGSSHRWISLRNEGTQGVLAVLAPPPAGYNIRLYTNSASGILASMKWPHSGRFVSAHDPIRPKTGGAGRKGSPKSGKIFPRVALPRPVAENSRQRRSCNPAAPPATSLAGEHDRRVANRKVALPHLVLTREPPQVPPTDWPTIVDEHGPDVWRTAYRLLSNHEDASDVYQETFLQAVEFARRNVVACWPAVLKRIVTAQSLDQLRRRYRAGARREPFGAIDEPAEPTPPPDALAQLREGMELLREAMTDLPPIQAEVFWLSEVEMLSHADIAAQLEATTDQVAVWLHRGKRKLRTLLTARGVLTTAPR